MKIDYTRVEKIAIGIEHARKKLSKGKNRMLDDFEFLLKCVRAQGVEIERLKKGALKKLEGEEEGGSPSTSTPGESTWPLKDGVKRDPYLDGIMDGVEEDEG